MGVNGLQYLCLVVLVAVPLASAQGQSQALEECSNQFVQALNQRPVEGCALAETFIECVENNSPESMTPDHMSVLRTYVASFLSQRGVVCSPQGSQDQGNVAPYGRHYPEEMEMLSGAGTARCSILLPAVTGLLVCSLVLGRLGWWNPLD